MIVGEVYLLDTALVAPYFGDDDELHLAFDFAPLYAPWDAGRGAPDEIADVEPDLVRRVADVGALQPRPAARTAPPTAVRSAGAGRRWCCC